MKIAMCFSGLFRTFEDTYDSIYKNFLEPYQPDTYIHTWDILGDPHGAHDKALMSVNTTNKLDFINDKLNPKALSIEPYLDKDPNNRQRNAMLCMLESIYKCNKLKNESNIDYDLVIRIRFDNFFLNSVPINVLENLKDDEILTPLWRFYDRQKMHRDMVDDQFAIGHTDAMNHYSEMINCVSLPSGPAAERIIATHLNGSIYKSLFYDIRLYPIKHNIKDSQLVVIESDLLSLGPLQC